MQANEILWQIPRSHLAPNQIAGAENHYSFFIRHVRYRRGRLDQPNDPNDSNDGRFRALCPYSECFIALE
jgi:hypothetical protein